MDISELDKNLAEAMDNFALITQTHFKENTNENATPADIDALAQQVFYVMGAFKDNIIEYLKSKY